MWYLYLRRDQHYMRSYRTHNLWLDTYAKKMRSPKITAWHVALLKRMSKSVSGVSSFSSVSCPLPSCILKQLSTRSIYLYMHELT